MNIDEIDKELKLLKSLIMNSTHIKTCTMISDELKRDVEKLNEHWARQQEQLDTIERKIDGISNGCSLSQQNLAEIIKLKDGVKIIYDEKLTEDIIKRLDEIEEFNKLDALALLDHVSRVTNLENHDIFKIWKSARQGGKNTLAAILNLNQGIKGMRGRINREQERINELERNYLLLNCNVKKRLDKLGGDKDNRPYDRLLGQSKDASVIDSKLPKLNVPEKYQPYENVSLDPTKPVYDDVPYCYQDKCVYPYKTPESFKRIKEFFDNRPPKKFTPFESEYKLEPKELKTFDLKVDLPDDLPYGKLMEAPDTIDFNGTLYGKIEDFTNDLDGDMHFHNVREKTRRKWKALLNG